MCSRNLVSDMKALEAFHMKCQHQVLGIRWSDFVSNVDAIGRNPGGPSHLGFWTYCPAWEWCSCAHGAPQVHRFVTVGRPPRPVCRGLPGRPRTRWIDQIRRDSNSSPAELWRRAIRHGLVVQATQRRRRPCDIDDDDDDDDDSDKREAQYDSTLFPNNIRLIADPLLEVIRQTRDGDVISAADSHVTSGYSSMGCCCCCCFLDNTDRPSLYSVR